MRIAGAHQQIERRPVLLQKVGGNVGANVSGRTG
jgi:hypothetical protein